jgi:hypothetical protein
MFDSWAFQALHAIDALLKEVSCEVSEGESPQKVDVVSEWAFYL